jgi:hypothetical protein
MPHMTQGYPFEWKVLGSAESLSTKLAGTQGYHSFLMVLDGNGSVRTLQFECPEDSWHQLTERLDRAGAAYLFFDPFDAPEYTWLSWRHIDRSTMERLIGDRFVDADFAKAQHVTSRAPDLEPPNTFPTSWEVMF